MNLQTLHYIEVFSELGRRLEGFGRDRTSADVVREASAANPWFSERDIVAAVEALREGMLARDTLIRWLEAYPALFVPRSPEVGEVIETAPGGDNALRQAAQSRQDVAVIMAGNIPAAGFFDMMCVLVCGHNCHAKPSSKDKVLIDYLAGLLRRIDPAIGIFDYDDGRDYDAAIASGSDNSNRYFRSRFVDAKSLLRGSRSSLAVLAGDETEEELRGLSRDIFLYNGMGCRSVGLLFLPEGCDVVRLRDAIVPEPGDVNPKYINNYRQRRALMSLRGEVFIDGGSFAMRCARDFPDAPSLINYSFYADPAEVAGWIAQRADRIQCVVSRKGEFLRGAVFGRAQQPRPWDYPDGVDVVRFLTSIQ